MAARNIIEPHRLNKPPETVQLSYSDQEAFLCELEFMADWRRTLEGRVMQAEQEPCFDYYLAAETRAFQHACAGLAAGMPGRLK